MLLRALTDGSVTGTGTLTVERGIFGGALITADGTNDTTVIVRKKDVNGKQLFKLVTKSPSFTVGPIHTENESQIYFSISGTGGAAQLYEVIP